MTRLQCFAILFSLLALPAFGQNQQPTGGTAATPAATSESAAVDGAVIAQKGSPSGAPACINCHASKGEGNASAGFPKLAGMPQEYLVKQLEDYASGVRNHPVMTVMAKQLTPAERESISQYYAKMDRVPSSASKKTNKALLQAGERLARLGDGKIQLQACNNCHGPDGVGVPPLIPGLAGQHASYLEAQLMAWKQGQRKNSPQQMLQIAHNLDEKSIKALAAYFQQVRTQ